VAQKEKATLVFVGAAAKPIISAMQTWNIPAVQAAHAPCQGTLRLFSAYSFEPAKE